jgi:phosphonoacetate hydrolase
MPVLGSQRVLIGMYDGLDLDYLRHSSMPVFRGLGAAGLFREVEAVMPSVTNANNVSICCGCWPAEHGITGNSYFDEAAGRAEYMEDGTFVRAPTLFERAAARGVYSALLTSKKKTVGLLARGADLAVAAEDPPPAFVSRYGPPPGIYSREINYWLWRVAADLLWTQPDLGCLYVHTTDYPMHEWPPDAKESQEHLATLDGLLGEARDAAPDAAFLLTADHGMNYKRRCWDLARACAARGRPLRFALSAERDRYLKHHRTFGGTAWVWLNRPEDTADVTALIHGLEGIEDVLPRAEAAARFRLMPERIGELMVLGDRDTVFGEMDTEREELEPTYRSHGSLHERAVPLVVGNVSGPLPPVEEFRANVDLTWWL